MKGIFLMRGLGVEVNTRVLQADGKRIHVNTAAILKSAALAGRGHSVSLELEYSAGETSYATIAGLGPITEVRKAGSVVAWTDNLDTAQEGWKTNAEGLLLLKLKHDEQRVKVSVTKK
ncbi:MAG: hypothetical protein NTV46_17200 [Verrucomicrobia bacterium]|nr:hypothetical protein [Verrucomicrobiota bacterium]